MAKAKKIGNVDRSYAQQSVAGRTTPNESVSYSLQLADGKYFGNVSYDAYKAITEGKLDSYKHKNNEEKAILDTYKKWTGYGKTIESVTNQYTKNRFGKGNMDLANRPILTNPNGSISTIDSITVEIDGKYVVLPTIVWEHEPAETDAMKRDVLGGPIKPTLEIRGAYQRSTGEAKRLATTEEAVEHYKNTGKHLGKFDTQEEADEYAQSLHIDQSLFYTKVPLTVEVDGKEKTFGQISYSAYKALSEDKLDVYMPVDAAEKKVLEEFKKFAEERAKKEREPEDFWQGLLHSAGYTVEKFLAGVLDFGLDIGDFALAGVATVARPFTWGSANEAVQDFAKERLNAKTYGDELSEDAESRFRVPDWYRQYGGTVAQGMGFLAIPMVAEYFSLGAAPTEGYTAAQLAKMSTTSSKTASFAKMLVKPKTSEILFGLGAAGSSSKEGYAISGDVGKSLNYGILNGLGEMATEKLFGGFAGTGIGPDEVIDVSKYASKIPKIGKLASTKYGKKVLNLAFEGVEEMIMADASPVFQRISGVNPNAESATWQDRGESFFQGILLSSAMNASTYALSKGINVANKEIAIRKLNKSAKELNATLPSEVTKFEPLKFTATIDQINERNNELVRIDAINEINGAINGINALFKNNEDKLELVKYDSTIDEIKQRQSEIAVFATTYADLMVDELVKNNPEKFKNIETTATEESSVPETPVVVENSDVVEPVATEQKNIFTEELDEIASTEMPTVSVGDTFIDTKTNNILKVVSRDDSNTTIEITKPSGEKEIKTHPNHGADTLAVDDRYNKVNTTVNTADNENTETPTETVAPQAEQSRVNVGDIYRNNKSSVLYAVVSRNETTTTVRNGLNNTFETMSNETADFLFNNTDTSKGDTFRKIQDGQSVSSAETETKPTDATQNSEDVLKNQSESAIIEEKTETDTDKAHTVAYTNDNERIDLKFKVVSVDDLVVSNELDGKVNPDYPQELQPRDRSRTSSQSQIRQMANNLNPARLAESTSVSEGSPIVGPDNVVESGNGRTLAIELAYEIGTADEYRNYIISNADKYGINTSHLPEKPILVRERLTEVDRTEFTRKANESSIGSLSATEQAKVDAEKLTEDVLTLLVANDKGIINTADNKNFISAVITKVFKNEDLNNVVNAEGNLSARGLERIKNAIFYKAYGDVSLSARLSESLDNDMKNATTVLLNIAPKVVAIKNGIASETMYGFDFSGDIAGAVRLFEKCRNNNMSIEDYAIQTSMFDVESPITMAMAYVFETKNKGAKQATDFYNLLLDTVIELGNPKQISLEIFEVFQTKEEILDATVKKFNTGVIAENTARRVEPTTKNTIAIPESIYQSTSEKGRENDRRGIDEVSGDKSNENEKVGNAVGVQQDNRPSEETGVVTDDEQLRQKNESVEGQSEVGKVEQKKKTASKPKTTTQKAESDTIEEKEDNSKLSTLDAELDNVIRKGSGFEGGKQRIVEFYSGNPSTSEAVTFLKNEYGIGGSTYIFSDNKWENRGSMEHDSKGIKLTDRNGNSRLFSWNEVDKRLRKLIENGEYLTNKEGVKDVESQSEVLAGESGNDDRGLHSETSETTEQETTERVDGQFGENSGETLSQSTGTDGNRPDVGNDSEGVHRGNDADISESEATGNVEKTAEETPETIETEDKSIEKKRPSNKGNFVITDDIATELDNAPPSAEDNIKAIELLLKLEDEGRPATAEEKKILAKYKGWGGIDIRSLPWELSRKVYDLYQGEQLRAMQSSESNAFFTPTKVIDAIYNGLKRMGFKGGNVLESSMGVGNFFGRMPAAMTGKSALTGVELESYTARIAQYLYPGATVINKPFQDVAIRNGSYDLVIGNVPFGTTKISYNKKKYSLHNYFIISSLDKVKDGGVVAVITSASTLDSYTLDTRKAIMDRADVVACYKLPAGVFSRNASTDVQTDLLILRKRASDAKPSGDSILDVTTTDDGLRLNEYFVKHPENVLGTLAKGTNAWGEITTVLDTGDFYDKLNNAMKKLPKDLISGKVELKPIETIVSTSSKPRFFEKNGKIYADDGAGTATEVTNRIDTVRDYMTVRDAYKDLLAAYESDMPESDIKPLRDALTKAYDNFSKKHGAITGDGKKKIGNKKSQSNTFLEADSDYYLVSGLERYNKDEKKIEKSELFEKDTLRKKKVTSVDSASDALAVSLNESGKIDFARMSELTEKNEKQLVEELKGEIVLTPEGDYVLTDIYLSGNIYEKIEAVKDKPEFKEQKEMLEKVLPTPKNASSIMVKLGANYIEPKYIEDFSREVFNERISVSKNSSGAWSIEGVRQSRWGDILNVKYGCDKFNAIQLLEKVLNDSEIIANKKIKIDGKSVDVFDEKMTEVARQKAQDIRDAFESWIFKDSERRTDIVDKYNRTYNNFRPLDYERIADKLSFDSMNETLKAKLYPHQKKGIARFLFGGNILFAHGVGTGKTFEMIASVMEAKRMGIINKAAMVVPNNKVVDFKNDIAEAYPNAKVLVIDTTDKKRQTMLGLVNSNDWDIVLIARTTFTKIPVSAELQQNYINQQLEDLDRQIMEAEYDRSISKRALDGLKKQRANLEQKLKDLDSETKRDENSVEFEKLGFDCICVDEAHNYKSITTPTKLNIKGLASGSDAQQANDMLMKLDYMRSIDGRIIFGTGTPITNTVAEIYNMMRMVSPDILEDAGIHSLDEWVNTFANIETITEIGIDNKIKNKSTQVIRNFVNATEMVGMFRQFADVVFTQDVVKNLPKAKYVSIELDGTDVLRQIESEISNAIANASGTETLKVYTKVMSMANAAAIDPKMLSGADSDVNIFKDYSLEELEYEDSKVNTMCNIVYDKYKASNDIKGTQIIFCDGGAGSGKIYSFNVHNDIKQKLIERGVPENEIVIVKNQKNAQLEELYDKVNSGEVRVLIGTSRKMAEGLNVQKRVVAIHHPTVTFKPSDLEQGDARGVRAGNINEEVEIYRYLQGNTFDSYKWQAIDRKGAMINAALRGESIDELEDIGADEDSDAGVDAATAMAITSGNPLVKEKIDIDKEVKRLKTLKQNFMNEYYRYQDVVAKNPSQIRRLTEFAQRIEKDIALRNKYGDKAVTSIKGKTFEKQTDANKALIEAVKTAPKNGQFTKIGEYNGFDIMFKGDTGGMNYALVLKGANEYSVEYAGNGNNIARIAGVLKRLDAELERVQNKVERLKSDLEFAKQEVNKPFEKEKDLTEALEKQKDITYRYEHFGETQSTEKTETAESETAETVHYSKHSVDTESDVAERWTTERNEGGKVSKDGINISQIVKSISEKFGIPIATGKVTNPEASAEYRERAETIRTRIANNLPDISHELGHHLDKKYELNKLDSVKKLQKAVPSEFLDQYPADEHKAESVAYFMETYLRNTNEASRLYPDFYADFVSKLSKDDLKAVNEIANAVNEYMSYNSDERYSAAIVTSEELAKEKASIKEKAHELRQKWVDPYLYIKDVVDYVEKIAGHPLSGKGNAYMLATNQLNAHSASNILITDVFRDLNGNIIPGAKTFMECISMVKSDDVKTLDEYLVLRHSLEWIAPTEEDVTKKRVFADVTLEDVEQIERKIAKIENEHPEIKEAAENLYEYQNNLLKYFVIPTGAITEETLNTLNRKYPSYVPFYRAVGKDKSLSGKAKSTFVNQASPIKTAKGSGELIISPLESIIKNTEKFVKLSLRNQVADVLGNYADTIDGFGKFMEPIAPDMLPHIINISKFKDTFLDELTDISKSSEDYFAVSDLFESIFGDSVMDFTPIANANKKIVTVLRNGKPVYYQVHDDNLYQSIAELAPRQLDAFKIVDSVMNTMKVLITQNNPIFAATNIIRDLGTAYKLSPTNNPTEFMARYLKAIAGVITNSNEYKQYKAMGGGHSSELTANIENISKTLRKIAEKDRGIVRRLAYAIFRHPIETIAMLNDKTESVARFAEFQRTLEESGDLQEAIFNANDLTTNFRKQGASTSAKVINKFFLFNNAAIQGLDKTARVLANKDATQRYKTWAKWLLHALLMGIVGYLYNKEVDEEGYKNLSSYKKNNFYNFAIGDGEFISIPKARENALLDSVVERAIEYLAGNDEAFYDFASYIGSQVIPPMLPNDFSSSDEHSVAETAIHSWLGSTALGGITDIGFNRDFKGTPIEGKYDEYLPINERYNESTTKIAYHLGQTKIARKMGLSPKKIDHLISSYTGIIGQANKALAPMNDERRDVSIGLRNKFVSDSNYSTDILNKLYENKDAAEFEWEYDNNINNAIEYEQNAVITSYISGMNKAIKALPDDKQREGRKYLLKTLNEWNYDLTAEQSKMKDNLENESISADCILEELPSSELKWTVNKQQYTYQMTPQEYNEYVDTYLKAFENARKNLGSDSPESYERAKEIAKKQMSNYKKGYLKGKYFSKATKVEE